MDMNIGVIKGDGIGPEIVDEAMKVLDKTAEVYGHQIEYTQLLMGGASIDVNGVPLTEETLEQAKKSDAVLMGSIGGDAKTSPWYRLEPSKRPEAGLLQLRKGLNLFANLRPAEKNKVMEAFVTGEIQVLVSTTVVEVGVNVPNATVMMIEDAQRFGLAQLHQLRGRVGRGNAQSYCILMNSSNGKNAKERLNILAGSNDGFYIASEDLKMRGPGDFFGVRQSGLMEFKIADVFSDADMLSIASEEAKEYVEKCNLNDCEKDMRLETTLKNAYKMTEYSTNI